MPRESKLIAKLRELSQPYVDHRKECLDCMLFAKGCPEGESLKQEVRRTIKAKFTLCFGHAEAVVNAGN